jgi:hypothetical protein
MELKAYYRLSTRSRRAISRKKTHFGRDYLYSPRGTLLNRLSLEFGMSREQVHSLLMQEREYILRSQQG